MPTVRTTTNFDEWIDTLRDRRDRARILLRIDRLQAGNFGDHRSVGDGVSEMRFTFGPGYRIYYVLRERTVVILLCGGDKGSQPRDIVIAKKLAQEV